ncbi:hypothetical protein ERO13_A10G178966v2 [Gossypium hirsutum]|nr:hypothetical protein ERO13_A10G178966v2 [Gossypium hirsutum]
MKRLLKEIFALKFNKVLTMQKNFEAGLQDFTTRLANYEKVYEPVDEGSYIKMIDMASGHGGQIEVNNISGYLPGRIVFFLVWCTIRNELQLYHIIKSTY